LLGVRIWILLAGFLMLPGAFSVVATVVRTGTLDVRRTVLRSVLPNAAGLVYTVEEVEEAVVGTSLKVLEAPMTLDFKHIIVTRSQSEALAGL
jgi:hypothetical protein